MDNGAKLAADWEDAYYVDFTQGGGDGARPIVLSYASSPPFTIPQGAKQPTTSALLDTCFRQVEYAGVLDDAANPEGARAFIDFLVSRQFQESLPDSMYVFPVDPEAKLPALWAKWAKPSPEPLEVDPADIAEHRAEWLTEWSDLTTR
jgi:thiamine transport system substrate-binding protein